MEIVFVLPTGSVAHSAVVWFRRAVCVNDFLFSPRGHWFELLEHSQSVRRSGCPSLHVAGDVVIVVMTSPRRADRAEALVQMGEAVMVLPIGRRSKIHSSGFPLVVTHLTISSNAVDQCFSWMRMWYAKKLRVAQRHRRRSIRDEALAPPQLSRPPLWRLSEDLAGAFVLEEIVNVVLRRLVAKTIAQQFSEVV